MDNVVCLFSYNRDTVSVAIIGDYMYDEPTVYILASLEHLLQYVKDNGWVTRNYTLMGMCEVRNTDSPGINLYYKLINNCNSTLKSLYRHTCKHLVSIRTAYNVYANLKCCNCDSLDSLRISCEFFKTLSKQKCFRQRW